MFHEDVMELFLCTKTVVNLHPLKHSNEPFFKLLVSLDFFSGGSENFLKLIGCEPDKVSALML